MKTKTISVPQQLIAMCLLLVFSVMTTTLHAQNTERTVTGVIKSYNEPVPFASVVLKGTMIGVSADEEGKFTFPKKLKENDVLVISSMAYTDQEFTITGNTSFIEPNLQANEIIIVGALRTAPTTATKKTLD